MHVSEAKTSFTTLGRNRSSVFNKHLTGSNYIKLMKFMKFTWSLKVGMSDVQVRNKASSKPKKTCSYTSNSRMNSTLLRCLKHCLRRSLTLAMFLCDGSGSAGQWYHPQIASMRWDYWSLSPLAGWRPCTDHDDDFD